MNIVTVSVNDKDDDLMLRTVEMLFMKMLM